MRLDSNIKHVMAPVVAHKAAAEVSNRESLFISSRGNLYEEWLLQTTDGRANPLMDPKVVGVVLLGMIVLVAVVTSPTTAGRSMA